ncbi:AfsR/SARP family transcriptional regulator [Pseudoxanthomonas broegbernensis]|uniref:AfsR/SARP family transcriptional regulator n=1 Tax=Pseudoxanthomonas broegbernensis TaxID=83619 RepID=UPI001391DA23|nr:BTAD domain-containing putative transcriptional regulator [Pseudoxanthomonas broegbernensis]MBB6065736.1 DNA-binding SARP family transcriptional activator [Pseudoxanthomonas broegbernensis]
MPGAPIRLLGECRIGTGTSEVALQYRKGWAVLAYLAVERGRRHPRTRLAALLWPDLDERAALTNLRQVLSNLNRAVATAVGDGVLQIDRESVRLCPVASAGLFDIDLIDAAGSDGGPDRRVAAWLADAGTLLEGIGFEGCEEFDEWLAECRAWFAQRLSAARERMRDAAAAMGDWRAAVALARQLVAQDPWNEGHQCALMRILAEKGEPDMALACYRKLVHRLQGDLGEVPLRETSELAERIRGACRRKAAPRLRAVGAGQLLSLGA